MNQTHSGREALAAWLRKQPSSFYQSAPLLQRLHQVSWAGAGGRSTRNLKLGLRAIHGKRLAWRMWAGIDGTPPISGLGAGVQRTASASAGFLLVR